MRLNSDTARKPVPNDTRLILFWNDGWGYIRDGKPSLFEKLNCPYSCILTTNRSFLKLSSGIVFDGPQYNVRDLPDVRYSWQRWIFFNHETSCYWVYYRYNWTHLYHTWNNVFNWTMTYHLDSDIPMMYGNIRKRNKISYKNFTELAMSKKKDVAWLASRCWTYSRRESYIQELKKYVDIDIYGGCGKRITVCEKSHPEDHWLVNPCFQMISRNYKFYLAFENAIADDYITEKFFRASQADMIVISRSGANYTRLGIHPEWFINTAQFESPKALADYIKKVSTCPSLYAKHLEWKNKYEAVSFRPVDRPAFCQLCEKLHNDSDKTYRPFVKIKQMIFKDGCRKPSDLSFLSKH